MKNGLKKVRCDYCAKHMYLTEKQVTKFIEQNKKRLLCPKCKEQWGNS
jgi:hypothetical protein